jgi:TolB-like protein
MKKLLCVIMLFLVVVSVFAQTRPSLAILPFTGGSGSDGETLAELFSFDRTLSSAFTLIPRTSITAAVRQEQNFQMASGMTDPETIARLGQQLGARYIVAGNITRLGRQQLLTIAIMQIENLELIAGEWRTFSNIADIRNDLSEMVRNIVAATQRDTRRLQRLAVLPFQTPSGDHEADVLAQILAIEILRAGTYAVFPRTRTLEQVQSEHRTQLSGSTHDSQIAAIGWGDNPLLALSGAARRLGRENMFNAAIIDVESGEQLRGDTVDYHTMEDGLEAIQTLARSLSRISIEYRVSNLNSLLSTVNTINGMGEGEFTIILTGDISVGSNDRDIRFTNNATKIITIRGANSVRSLSTLRNNEPLLRVGQGITLVLGENLRLSSTNARGIIVGNGGTLRMEDGSTITSSRGGVSVEGGVFIMNGGTIRDNTNSGGVNVITGGTFNMIGGTISGNTSEGMGGGVHVYNAVFIKTGGTISGDNRARSNTFNDQGHVVHVHGGHLPRRWLNSAAGSSTHLDSRNTVGWEIHPR